MITLKFSIKGQPFSGFAHEVESHSVPRAGELVTFNRDGEPKHTDNTSFRVCAVHRFYRHCIIGTRKLPTDLEEVDILVEPA